MPKPAFSSIKDDKNSTESKSYSAVDTTKKPKTLVFGDALVQGLPENWSIVPPDAGIIRKPNK